MTKQELAEKLADIYVNSGTIVTASLGVFTFTYGEYAVDKFTPTELIEAAHAINPDVKTRYGAELNAAFAMYRYFKSHPNLFALGRTGLSKGKKIIGHARQLITYGAPGTGKSHGIEEVVKVYADTVRTTFHPDSDFATFVGCYKPTMERVKKTYVLEGKEADVKDDGGNPVFGDRIVYSYVPQAFTKAYVRAWRKMVPDADGKIAPQFLVIEEINRGNCAQIFGDLFQLLDRDGAGYSKYAIEADSDLAKHIAKELADISSGIPSEICSGKILKLPPNLYIWATMNTSDQSLFPMDSAFKRRWEWEYIPIRDAGKDWKIVADGEEFKWWDFIKVINKYILDTLKNEDKQLGYFFARPDDDASDKIAASKFVNKVLFYLFNDVFKDYDLPKGFAKQGGGKFSFGDFFLADGKPNEPAVKELLTGLLKTGA